MTGMIEIIKQVAVNAVEARKPVALLFGTVSSLAPLKIRLSQQEEYPKEFFLALDPAPAFEEGDRLVLLRFQGGQQFLILGKEGSL